MWGWQRLPAERCNQWLYSERIMAVLQHINGRWLYSSIQPNDCTLFIFPAESRIIAVRIFLKFSCNTRHTCFYTVSVKALKPQVPSILRFLAVSGHLLRIWTCKDPKCRRIIEYKSMQTIYSYSISVALFHNWSANPLICGETTLLLMVTHNWIGPFEVCTNGFCCSSCKTPRLIDWDACSLYSVQI